MQQIDLDSSVACLRPFRVTRVTPGLPDLEFRAIFCHGRPGRVRNLVNKILAVDYVPSRDLDECRFWAITNEGKRSDFIEMRHGLRRGHAVLFHRDASTLPLGIEEGRLYIVTNALKFSFIVSGPILCPLFALTEEQLNADLSEQLVVIRRSPVGRYVSALQFMFAFLCARTSRSHVDTWSSH